MFCMRSLMPHKLNALITLDLRWSALVTVPLHVFSFDSYGPSEHTRASGGQPNDVKAAALFFFFFLSFLVGGFRPQSEVHLPTQTVHTVGDACLRPVRLAGPLFDLRRLDFVLSAPSAPPSNRSCSNPNNS